MMELTVADCTGPGGYFLEGRVTDLLRPLGHLIRIIRSIFACNVNIGNEH